MPVAEAEGAVLAHAVTGAGSVTSPAPGLISFYDQNVVTDSRNGNQRFDARFEWTPDSLNSMIVQPRLYFQRSQSASLASASNSTEEVALSAALNDLDNTTDANNLSNRLTLRHRFAKRGRNISADVNMGHMDRDGDGSQFSLTDYFDGSTTTRDTLDQRSTTRTTTNSFSTRMAFTEPVVAGSADSRRSGILRGPGARRTLARWRSTRRAAPTAAPTARSRTPTRVATRCRTAPWPRS